MDYAASIADMLHFYVDRYSAEAFIDRVETRGGLISILKLIGFQPQNPQPESAEVTFTLDAVRDTDTVIPIYTKIRTTSGLEFCTASALTIGAGFQSATVSCIQGVWKTAKFTANGGPNQRFLIQSQKIADGRFRVFVEGNEYVFASDNTFVGHSATDTVFRYIYTEDRRSVIEFGDDIEGFAPEKGSSIEIRYMETEHVNGKAKSQEINALIDNIPGVSVSLLNADASSGGVDFESIESARLRYPAAFKPIRRAVTLSDWEVLAKLVPGVMQAKAVDLNLDPSLAHFIVKLYVIGNSGVVSGALNTAVREVLANQKVNATIFEVLSPAYVPVAVDIDLITLRTYAATNVQAAVAAAIEDFFTMTSDDSSEVKLSENVRLSRLTAKIQAVPGVSSFSYNSPTSDVSIGTNEFAKLSTVKITVKGTV
jgi:phage-related baseplate assembly protein